MASEILLEGDVVVLDYRCDAEPHDAPFAEVHERFSISYVRCGSFGCHTQGHQFDLVAGGFLLGAPGDEFTCSHDHHVCGDRCLSIQLGPDVAGTLPGPASAWRIGALPPLAELSLAGEFVLRVAGGGAEFGLDEAALWLAARFLLLGVDTNRGTGPLASRQRRAMVEAADWIDAHSCEDIDLATAARAAGLSPFHFLRMFKAVTGITPHQHLVRARLRRAAQRLLDDDVPITDVALDVGFADLSNFINRFRRAAGVSPSRFRRLPKHDRKIFQAQFDGAPLPFRA
jgi:AraC-like DNA-binding protein